MSLVAIKLYHNGMNETKKMSVVKPFYSKKIKQFNLETPGTETTLPHSVFID